MLPALKLKGPLPVLITADVAFKTLLSVLVTAGDVPPKTLFSLPVTAVVSPKILLPAFVIAVVPPKMLPVVLVIAEDVPLEALKLVSLVLTSVVSVVIDGTVKTEFVETVPNLKIDAAIKVGSDADAETEKLLFPLVLAAVKAVVVALVLLLATLLEGMLDDF